MKRYISAILIPCLLLQLFGCYTYELIQKNEIDNFYEDKTIIIKTTDEKEYILQKDVSTEEIIRNPNVNYCTEYQLKNDSLVLINKNSSSQVIKYDATGSLIYKIDTDSLVIHSNLISEIGFHRVNPWSVVIPIVIVVVIGGIIIKSEIDHMFDDVDLLGGGK